MTATMRRPERDESATIAMLRDRCPCDSTDPMERMAYEQALREWARLTPEERSAVGFGAYWAGRDNSMF